MESTTADYIVVGGGLTGCVIASRLAQAASSLSVILIEAGPDPTGEPGTDTVLAGLALLGGKLDYAYQSEPVAQTSGRVHTLPAGNTLGGGSILNYGGWLVADSKDYDAWGETVGDERWSYAGIKPWLSKAEKHFHVTSISEDPERTYPLRHSVASAWKELGVVPADDSNGSMTGLSELKENLNRDGVRQPSYAAYPLKAVNVFTNTTVKRVTFSDQKATGVELTDGRALQAKKEVILCAGAYRSPQLLLSSGIGPEEILSANGIPIIHNSPEVGRNLFDHFAVYMAFRLRDPAKNLALGSLGWTKPSLFKGLPYDWAVSERLPQKVSGKYTDDATLTRRNLFEVLTVYVPPGIPGIPIDGTHIATSTMLLLPTSRGTVSIKSASSDASPSIQPNYLATDLDRDTIIYATRRTLEAMLGTETMKQYIASETPPSGSGLDGLDPLTPGSSDEAIMERIKRCGMQHHHSGGTAAMGKVVDSEGKVIGVAGLRIADASVLPCPLGGHPQASLYAMAEQLASFIVA